jgi:hypothetical protein
MRRRAYCDPVVEGREKAGEGAGRVGSTTPLKNLKITILRS